jgi:uncharacterized membrane protein
MTLPPEQMLVHFYRAVVAHMDVWRQRMDATTNWAAATSAGMITFAFSTPSSPHFVLLLALGFQAVFLLMESRRYQTFDLWRHRFRSLNRHLVGPALRADAELTAESQAALAALAVDLGRLVPQIALPSAVGYRIRRNYGYLFLVTLVAWILRLELIAGADATVREVIAVARIGPAPGELVLGGVLAAALGGLLLGFLAPSERMLDWVAVPPPLSRWKRPTLGAP